MNYVALFGKRCEELDLEPLRQHGGKLLEFQNGQGIVDFNLASRIFTEASGGKLRLSPDADPHEVRTIVCDLYQMAQLAIHGVKVIRPTEDICNTLLMPVNVSVSEYCQPFSTVIVEFPPLVSDEGECPTHAIISHVHRGVFIRMCFACGERLRSTYIRDILLEEHIAADINHVDSPTIIEWRNATRIALNCCLMLMTYGYKHEPESNKLLRNLRKKINSKDQIKSQRAKDKLLETPQVICFDHAVHIMAEKHRHECENGTPQGGTKAPHWRKSHRKMQAYGKGWKDHREIVVPATFVNGSEEVDLSKTVYTMRVER